MPTASSARSRAARRKSGGLPASIMLAPTVMAPAAPAPSVMMAAAAALDMMSVSVPVTPDLNRRVVLRGERPDSQPGGSGCGHRQRREQCETNQHNAFHAVFL